MYSHQLRAGAPVGRLQAGGAPSVCWCLPPTAGLFGPPSLRQHYKDDVEADEGEQQHDAQQVHGNLARLPVGHVEAQLCAAVAGRGLLVRVRVDGEGEHNQGDLEDAGGHPCRQMGCGGRGLRVEQGDEEQAVHEEGAHEIDLGPVS
jgi:hypothetical protein